LYEYQLSIERVLHKLQLDFFFCHLSAARVVALSFSIWVNGKNVYMTHIINSIFNEIYFRYWFLLSLRLNFFVLFNS
jgi:hypothetical protein